MTNKTIQPDYFKHLKSDIVRLADYNKQEMDYDRNFYRFMDYILAYKANDIEKRSIYNFETPKTNFYYKPTLIRPTNEDYDGYTPYFLNSLNNRKIDVSGTLYDIKDIPIRHHSSVRQY